MFTFIFCISEILVTSSPTVLVGIIHPKIGFPAFEKRVPQISIPRALNLSAQTIVYLTVITNPSPAEHQDTSAFSSLLQLFHSHQTHT